MAQLLKNLPAMWETWAQSLCWEDPCGEGKDYPLLCSGLENLMDCTVVGSERVGHDLVTFNFHNSIGLFEIKVVLSIQAPGHIL